MTKESNLVRHARRELELAGMPPTPPLSSVDRALIWLKLKKRPPFDYNGAIGASVLSLLKSMADDGHSGFSASATISAFEKLARFEPLTPLTGADDEWNEIGEGAFQNNRCGRVFKEADGSAYDINGKVFVEPGGSAYTGSGSRTPITFPYTPKTEYVPVDEEGNPK